MLTFDDIAGTITKVKEDTGEYPKSGALHPDTMKEVKRAWGTEHIQGLPGIFVQGVYFESDSDCDPGRIYIFPLREE